MRNHNSVRCVSIILIYIFHLWIYLFDNLAAEQYVRTIGYIGVDIFFFLSAYGVSLKGTGNIGTFLASRLKKIYPKYLLLSIIAALYSGWKIVRLIKVLSGFELIVKGGGAFLWFIPAIILMYILLAAMDMTFSKKPWLTIVTVIFVWLIVGLMLSMLTDYRAMFIVWNRIPIVVIGFCQAKYVEGKGKNFVLAGLILLIVGGIITYNWGFREKLSFPIRDMFYVINIPLVLGIVLLADNIKENRLIRSFSKLSLEIYAFQMIVGYDICNFLLKNTEIGAMGINLLTFLSVLIVSLVFQRGYNACLVAFHKKK